MSADEIMALRRALSNSERWESVWITTCAAFALCLVLAAWSDKHRPLCAAPAPSELVGDPDVMQLDPTEVRATGTKAQWL